MEEWCWLFAAGNPLAILAISLALAGPLLYLTGYEGGGVNLFGPSSIGKTTIARLNVSVWARGDERGGLRSWRTTSNAIEGTLAGANDTGLTLDELSQVDTVSFYEMIYMIAGGVGKSRMRRDTSLREAFTWRLFVFSTGEFPVETKLGEGRGRKSRAGQTVRMIDIKADRKFGAFDDLKGLKPVPLAAACKHEATTHYGTAGPAFVRRLIEDGVTGENIRTRVLNFGREQLSVWRDVSGQAARVAERFGLIAAAGELAIEFGIVPWRKGEARAAAATFLRQWLEARGGAKPFEDRQAVVQVRGFIKRFGESRFCEGRN
jgi:putative DNA primase/helicase